MTESPKIRKVSFGQVLLVVIICVFMLNIAYIFRAMMAAHNESRQFLQQMYAVDATISKTPPHQLFHSPEGTALQAHRTDLWDRSEAAAARESSFNWQLLLADGSYFVAMFGLIFVARRDNKKALTL